MRWIVLYIFAFSLRCFSGEPSDIALNFVRGLDGSVTKADLSKELAISPYCGPVKRKRIDDLWRRRGDWSKSGKFEFSPINEIVDGDLASVIIGASSPDGPDVATVLTLGLVKKGDGWKLAPVEGSFDNTGLGFSEEITRRIGKLEYWMAVQRIDAMTTLRRSEMERFRKAMEGAISPGDLAMDDPKKVLSKFIEAAESKDTSAVIVWQGFLERDDLPDRDWERCLRVTRLGMADKDKQRIWRLLNSRKIMKVIVEEENLNDDGEAEFLVGFLSSFETGPLDDRINPVRFSLRKTGQGWRVVLPAYFLFADEDRRNFQRNTNNWEDRQSVKQMFGVFEKSHEQAKSADPEAVMNGVVEELKKEGLTPFLQRLYREKREVKKADDDDAEEELPLLIPQRNGRRWRPDDFENRRMGRYMEAVKWWSLALGKDRDTIKAEITKIYKKGKIALGILNMPTTGESWEPEYRRVWMSQEEDGWVILPGSEAPLSNSVSEEQLEVAKKLAEEFAKDSLEMKKEFLVNVLKIVGIENPNGSAASEENAKKLVSEWRETAGEGTMMNLLKSSAVRKLPDDPKDLLKNLGYVRKGALVATEPDRTLGSKAVGRFRGVSVMVHGRAMVEFPLMFVVPTQEGHRILVDIELPFEVNKGWQRLNEGRMEDLAEELSKEDLASIKELRKWHQGLSKPEWEKWKLQQAKSEE